MKCKRNTSDNDLDRFSKITFHVINLIDISK